VDKFATIVARVNVACEDLMLKDLKAHEKQALIFQLESLFECDETSAILATLQRIAERKAFACTRGRVDYEAALSWQALADALHAVRGELELAERRKSRLTDI
jgi:hypothetical protein